MTQSSVEEMQEPIGEFGGGERKVPFTYEHNNNNKKYLFIGWFSIKDLIQGESSDKCF